MTDPKARPLPRLGFFYQKIDEIPAASHRHSLCFLYPFLLLKIRKPALRLHRYTLLELSSLSVQVL